MAKGTEGELELCQLLYNLESNSSLGFKTKYLLTSIVLPSF